MSKPDASIQDSYLVYPGFIPQSWGICHVRLVCTGQGSLVVASEIRYNPGPSVTNAIEGIWCAILKRYPAGILGDSPLFVEHYNDEAVYGEAGLGERLAMVRLGKGSAAWRHTTPAEIAALVGCAPQDLSIPFERLVILGKQGEPK